MEIREMVCSLVPMPKPASDVCQRREVGRRFGDELFWGHGCRVSVINLQKTRPWNVKSFLEAKHNRMQSDVIDRRLRRYVLAQGQALKESPWQPLDRPRRETRELAVFHFGTIVPGETGCVQKQAVVLTYPDLDTICMRKRQFADTMYERDQSKFMEYSNIRA